MLVRKIFFTIAAAFYVVFAGRLSAQELEKVRIVYASRSIPFLSSFVAKEKGFYRSHGLDVELIQTVQDLWWKRFTASRAGADNRKDRR